MLERREKHAMMRAAALTCFASRSQQAWQRWRLYISRQKKLHQALQQHQVRLMLLFQPVLTVLLHDAALD